ncbi:hypothetical protein FSARC_9323 [Fusarium sarcochroum]|uniref:Mid2 domain-containing protein n=1 Tax=Fusarium sarcochroum TaxID=1208366 RepID=A0A8H4TR31_9HYPO|nr:hypothetical protein FSARC_9323 [Fusarium sarcochroum]
MNASLPTNNLPSEECVRGGKINLCTLSPKEVKNPLPEIGSSVLEDLYASMNSSDPSETYMSFDPSSLIVATQSSSSTAQLETTTSASTESTTADAISTSGTGTATDTPEPGSALSGGAIGGIVAGSVVGVALLALGAWFLWKKNRRPTVATADYVDETKNHQHTRQVTELESRHIQEMP